MFKNFVLAALLISIAGCTSPDTLPELPEQKKEPIPTPWGQLPTVVGTAGYQVVGSQNHTELFDYQVWLELSHDQMALAQDGYLRQSMKLEQQIFSSNPDDERFGRFTFWLNENYRIWRMDDYCGVAQNGACQPSITYPAHPPAPFGIGLAQTEINGWVHEGSNASIDYVIPSKFLTAKRAPFTAEYGTFRFYNTLLFPSDMSLFDGQYHLNATLINTTEYFASISPSTTIEPLVSLGHGEPFPGSDRPLFGLDASFFGAMNRFQEFPMLNSIINEGCILTFQANSPTNPSALNQTIPATGMIFELYVNHGETIDHLKVVYQAGLGYLIPEHEETNLPSRICNQHVGESRANFTEFYQLTLNATPTPPTSYSFFYAPTTQNRNTYSPAYNIQFESDPEFGFLYSETYAMDATTGLFSGFRLTAEQYERIDDQDWNQWHG